MWCRQAAIMPAALPSAKMKTKIHFTATLLNLLLSMTAAATLMAGCVPQKPAPKESVAPREAATSITLPEKTIQQIGIKTCAITRQTVSEEIATTGQIAANENKVFHINSLAPGRIIDDRVILGDVIRQGQTLAIIENLEVAKIYADFVRRLHENEVEIKDAETRLELVKSNLARTKQLFEDNIAPRKDLIQAETDYTLSGRAVAAAKEKSTHIEEEAKSLLGAYGVTPHDLKSEKLQTTSPIISSRGGVITKKNVTVGDVVVVQQTLYEVADLSEVWLNISIYDKDLARVREGQAAGFVSDSLPGLSFTGPISYIRPSTGDNSRTFLARVILQNPRLLLKPGMFGQVKIQKVAEQSYPFVPEEAVQTYGKESFVFQDRGGGLYQKKILQLDKKVSGGYLVQTGLNAGDKIVTRGAFNLKANLLKSQFSEDN